MISERACTWGCCARPVFTNFYDHVATSTLSTRTVFVEWVTWAYITSLAYVHLDSHGTCSTVRQVSLEIDAWTCPCPKSFQFRVWLFGVQYHDIDESFILVVINYRRHHVKLRSAINQNFDDPRHWLTNSFQVSALRAVFLHSVKKNAEKLYPTTLGHLTFVWVKRVLILR